MAVKKYCLVSDDSGHNYVIPTDKRNEWYKLDPEDCEIPEWAERVEGGLEFENPSEQGLQCFPDEQSSTQLLEEISAWLSFTFMKPPSKQDIADLYVSIKKHLGTK